ncbi:MAG: TonB-dependent receptor, partial [Acidobacteriaceae bacterium]
MIRKATICLAIALASLFFSMSTAFGQLNTGTITGAITDPSGAVVPSAKVKVSNNATGLARTTLSTSSGQYSLSFLPPGTYSLSAAAKGFQTEARTGLTISAGQFVTMDIRLKIGQASQTVTVSGASSQLNYSNQEQRAILSGEAIHQLPTPKEDWTSLLSTTMPGVQGSSAADNSSISMNGLPPAAMNLTVDGMNAQPDPETPSFSLEGGFQTINVINTSSIDQVIVTKGVAPASAGSGMAGNVNIITKGGTNQFHGSLYEFNRNAAYNARNQFATTKPPSNFNQFGSSLGGPVLKNRLFFFGSYEGVRNPTFAIEADDMPTPEFIQSTLAVAPEYAPVFNVFPPPNQPCDPGAVTCRRIVPESEVTNDNNAAARLDYNINSGNQLTLRVVSTRPYQLNPSILPSNPRTFYGHTNLYSVQLTHSTANWTAATRFGFNWAREARLDHGFLLGTPEVHFSGFNSQGGENFNILGHTGTLKEDVSVTHGRHLIEFGGIAQLNTDGRIDDTTNQYKYSSLDDFLANIPSTIEINFPLTDFQLHRWEIGGYLQDTYRLTPAITVDAGLRYDYWTVPKERDGRLFSRDPGPAGVPGTGALRPPSQAYKSYWPNFGPRIGLTWGLGAKRNTVLRTGFGMFYGVGAISGGVIDDVLDNEFVPFRLTLDREQGLAMGLNFPVDTDTLAATIRAEQIPVATTAISNHFPNPRSFQYMFDIQHKFANGFVLDSG